MTAAMPCSCSILLPIPPLQAEKEVKIGGFYLKKGSYLAAANRFQEATKWNPGYAEAYFWWGVAEEKLKDAKTAREAWSKFLELAPEPRYKVFCRPAAARGGRRGAGTGLRDKWR